MTDNYCGTCRHHKKDSQGEGEWVCTCEEAEDYGIYTPYNYTCIDYEGRRTNA